MVWYSTAYRLIRSLFFFFFFTYFSIFCLDRLVKYVTKDFNLVFAVSEKRPTYPSLDILMRIGAANDWMMVLWCVRWSQVVHIYIFSHCCNCNIDENIFNSCVWTMDRLVFMFILFMHIYRFLILLLLLLFCRLFQRIEMCKLQMREE